MISEPLAVVYALRDKLRHDPDFTDVTIYGGWPEDCNFGLPAISIQKLSERINKGDGRLYHEDKNGVFFLMGYYEFSIELDLWTKTKTEASKYDVLIRNMFFRVDQKDIFKHPTFGLNITPATYILNARVDLINVKNFDTNTTIEGYFRHNYQLECDLPYLRFAPYKPGVNIHLNIGTI